MISRSHLSALTVGAVASGLVLAACGSGAQSNPEASNDKYVAAVRQEANAAARQTNALIDDIAGLASGVVDIDSFGAHAQALRESAGDFYQHTLMASDIGNDDQVHLGVAVKDLRDAASAGVAFSESNTGAKAQAFGSKLGEARIEWNSAVSSLWRAAGLSPVPTIKPVSS